MLKSCKEGVHKFKPRYDIVSPKWMEKRPPGRLRGDAKGQLYEEIYVKDVCVRCGKEINRDSAGGGE